MNSHTNVVICDIVIEHMNSIIALRNQVCDVLQEEVQTKLNILKAITLSEHTHLQYTTCHEQWRTSLATFKLYWKETMELIEAKENLQIVYESTLTSLSNS